MYMHTIGLLNTHRPTRGLYSAMAAMIKFRAEQTLLRDLTAVNCTPTTDAEHGKPIHVFTFPLLDWGKTNIVH